MSVLKFKNASGAWTAIEAIKGDKGDKGATGATGAKGDKGDKGETGVTGATGNGIASIEKTGTSGLVDTYTITYTDGTTTTFTVTNGADGAVTNIDDTLTQQGKPADAKKVGDEITDLKGDISELDDRTLTETKRTLTISQIVQGTYISQTGELSYNANRIRCVGFLKINAGDVMHFVQGTKIKQILYGTYTSEKVFVSDSLWYNREVEIPFTDDCFIIVVFATSTKGVVSVSDYDAVLEITSHSTIKQDVEKVNTDYSDLKQKAIIENSITLTNTDIISGSFSNETGDVVTDPARLRNKGFLQVSAGDVIHFTQGTNIKQFLYGSYTSDKTYINTSYWLTDEEVSITHNGFIIIVFANGQKTRISVEDFDATVSITSTEGVSDVYTELNAKLDADINNTTQYVNAVLGSREIEFIDGYYLNYNLYQNKIDLDTPVESSTGYKYAKVICSEGDRFIVSGVSATNAPLAWAFTDINGIVLSKSGTSVTVVNEKISAPPKTAYLIINDNSNTQSYKVSNDDIISDIFNKTEYPKYIGGKKVEQYTELKWTPKSQVPKQGGATYFPSGVQVTGMLYSDVYQIFKSVGFDVSLRTFMTAVNNPYSLLYTENINGSHSQSAYGVVYHGDANAGAYMGASCNILVMRALGCTIPYTSYDVSGWANKSGIFIKIYDQSATGVELLDILRQSGHVAIITGLTKDANGVVTAVQYSEAIRGGSVTHNTISAEAFNSLLASESFTIYRYRDLYKNLQYEQSPFVAVDDEMPESYVYNDDICTFAGDYACFAEGDLLHINYTKGAYTSMQIYKDDTLLETITLDASADVHDVDLTNKGYTYGMYKARLTDGTNNSDYTYFEIVNAELTYTDGIIYANSANGTPLYWGWTNSAISTREKYLFGGVADVSKGVKQSNYDRLFVVFSGQYGRIARILIPE